MPNLKKVISLHQASIISGYHQDYLSSLIRKGEINGEKMGGNWLTTEEEIERYIFKQKIRNKNWLVRNFLLLIKKTNKSLLYAVVCLIIFSTGLYFYNKNNVSEIKTNTQTNNIKISNINQLGINEEFKELKF